MVCYHINTASCCLGGVGAVRQKLTGDGIAFLQVCLHVLVQILRDDVRECIESSCD
jgi:hypothetical protein